MANDVRIENGVWRLASWTSRITRATVAAKPVLPEADASSNSGAITSPATVLTVPLVSPELELLSQRALGQRAVAAYLAQAELFLPLLSASGPKA